MKNKKSTEEIGWEGWAIYEAATGKLIWAVPGLFDLLDEEQLAVAVKERNERIADREGRPVDLTYQQITLPGEDRALLISCSWDDRLIDRLQLLEEVLDAVAEGILVTDAGNRIIYYNRALSKMEGLEPRETVGRLLTDVYQVTPDNSEHLQAVKTGRHFKELSKMHFTSDGREINLVSSTYPVSRKGEVLGAFSVCQDVTTLRHLIDEKLQLQKQMHGSGGNGQWHNGSRYTFADFIYAGDKMRKIVRQAEKAAQTDCSVLVYGETGTGKEVIAQSIHNSSANRKDPFVGINCAAIPETLLESLLFGTVKGAFTGAVDSSGLFEQAGRGSLFLDEVNSMSIALQAKLLRVLQERTFRRVGGRQELPVKCRILSSTNQDPWECIIQGTLREDLYYRLAVITIMISPLRERPEDIDALLVHFIKRYRKVYGQKEIRLDASLREALLKYDWPGNVRELEHVVESCLVMLEPEETEITADHLPPFIRSKLFSTGRGARKWTASHTGSLHQVLEDAERETIKDALEAHGGNITRTARSLGILRQNLQYRMRRLGIKTSQSGLQ